MKKCNSMQLTRAADYAVRVMLHLAKIGPNCRVPLPALVASASAPPSFLSKVLQQLTRARLITSCRGPNGGFQISICGRQASMLQVIEAIEGPMSLNLCLSEGRTCPRKSWCPAHPVWVKAQKALLDVLSTARIADLAAGTTPISALVPREPLRKKTGTDN